MIVEYLVIDSFNNCRSAIFARVNSPLCSILISLPSIFVNRSFIFLFIIVLSFMEARYASSFCFVFNKLASYDLAMAICCSIVGGSGGNAIGAATGSGTAIGSGAMTIGATIGAGIGAGIGAAIDDAIGAEKGTGTIGCNRLLNLL